MDLVNLNCRKFSVKRRSEYYFLEGVFSYRTYNDYTEEQEPIGGACADEESNWASLSMAVESLVERGESCLVFVKAEHEARYGARCLAESISGIC